MSVIIIAQSIYKHHVVFLKTSLAYQNVGSFEISL